MFPGNNSSTLEELAERLLPPDSEGTPVTADDVEKERNVKNNTKTDQQKDDCDHRSSEQGKRESDGSTGTSESALSEFGT